jgi:putative tryptophan/tyrosine transport system substrate-binding protein
VSRRALLIVLGALPLPLRAFAQQPKVFRIGYLANQHDPRTTSTSFQAFVAGLRELGWIEGKNIEIRIRTSGGRDEMFPYLAGEFVRENVDLIVTTGSGSTRAAKAATDTIPIVFASSADPVQHKIVESLARPGGNVTGLAFLVQDLVPKRLQLLKEALPRLSRIARVYYAGNPKLAPTVMPDPDTAAAALGMTLDHIAVRGPEDIEGVFAAARNTGAEAAMVEPDAIFIVNRVALAAAALKYRLPMMTGDARYADAGALIAYGEDFAARYRRAAFLVHQVLQGAKPADIPVEQPTFFELVINLKTAKALGVSVPTAFLQQASRVIG